MQRWSPSMRLREIPLATLLTPRPSRKLNQKLMLLFVQFRPFRSRPMRFLLKTELNTDGVASAVAAVARAAIKMDPRRRS